MKKIPWLHHRVDQMLPLESRDQEPIFVLTPGAHDFAGPAAVPQVKVIKRGVVLLNPRYQFSGEEVLFRVVAASKIRKWVESSPPIAVGKSRVLSSNAALQVGDE